jgi:hypothetical protein
LLIWQFVNVLIKFSIALTNYRINKLKNYSRPDSAYRARCTVLQIQFFSKHF